MKQFGLKDNNNYIKNLEKLIKAKKHPNDNSKSANQEKSTIIRGHTYQYLNKNIDSQLIVDIRAVTLIFAYSSLAKVSAIIDTFNNNFNTLYIL